MKQLTHQTFKNELNRLIINPKQTNFLLAISGGVDSMVLLHLFHSSNFNFQVAHINYKLRGEHSDLDEQLVSDFCKKYDIKLHLYQVSNDEKPKNSIQIWARELRYAFFNKIQKAENIQYLVTAHHLNDQLETFIINLSRGSGLKGLSGIPKNENHILRPLLAFEKQEIYRFAKAENVQFREDASNQKNDYLRNQIRNQIVPLLLETNDYFMENFRKSIDLLSESHWILEEKKEILKKEIFQEKGNSIFIKKKYFFELNDFLKFELLKDFGFNDVSQIKKMKTSQTGSVFHFIDFQINIDRDDLVITKKNEIKNLYLEEKIIDFKPSEKNLELKIDVDNEFPIPNQEWLFDAEKLIFPLKIRTKKEGDFFYPKGMTGKKKVSKFFKDEKISNLAKSKIKILCDGNDDILGIIPFRQDGRFVADKTTRRFFKIIFKP